MMIHPLWLKSSPWLLLVLINLIFIVHFSFEAHFLPQNFSNVTSYTYIYSGGLSRDKGGRNFRVLLCCWILEWLIILHIWIIHFVCEGQGRVGARDLERTTPSLYDNHCCNLLYFIYIDPLVFPHFIVYYVYVHCCGVYDLSLYRLE